MEYICTCNHNVQTMKADKNHTLTRAEMQVMNILWSRPEGLCIHDILSHYPDPKPAYTTVSTFLKILSCKNFVDVRKGQGKQQIFSPAVTRQAYTRRVMEEVKDNFFDGSASSLLRFFVKEEQLTEQDVADLLKTAGLWEA